MSRPSKYSGIVVNLLIAVAISLVVNFSYVLLLVVEKSDDRHPPFSRELRTDREIVRVEGDVWISPDGHGYLLYVSPERLSDGDAAATGLAEVAPARDSVYIPRNSARFLRLRSATICWPTRSNRTVRADGSCWDKCWNATASRSITE